MDKYVGRFIEVIITPNIASEVSNLIGCLYGEYLTKARAILAAVFEQWPEVYAESVVVKGVSEYSRLGLTDAATLLCSSKGIEVLTDDFDLYVSLAKRGVKVTNFTHVRTAGMVC